MIAAAISDLSWCIVGLTLCVCGFYFFVFFFSSSSSNLSSMCQSLLVLLKFYVCLFLCFALCHGNSRSTQKLLFFNKIGNKYRGLSIKKKFRAAHVNPRRVFKFFFLFLQSNESMWQHTFASHHWIRETVVFTCLKKKTKRKTAKNMTNDLMRCNQLFGVEELVEWTI